MPEIRSFRRGLLALTVTAALGMVTALPATATAPAPGPAPGIASISPAPSYTPIDGCSLAFTPSTFSATDTFTVTATFGSTPGWYRIGADNLGRELASVLANAPTTSSTVSIPVATVRDNWGLAPGPHSMEFYAVDGTGAAVGSPLCTTNYTFAGEPDPFMFEYDGFADFPDRTGAGLDFALRVGEPTDSGSFTYTPTAAARMTSCRVAGAQYDPGAGWGGTGGRGGAGGSAGTASAVAIDVTDGYGGSIDLEPGLTADGFNTTVLVGTGLAFVPAVGADLETARRCGKFVGTPTLPGNYTLILETRYVNPWATTPGAVPMSVTVGVDQQTYVATHTFTFVVQAAPVFTG